MQSLIGLLDEKISLLPFWVIILIYTLVLLLVVFLSIWRKWLTSSGILGAFLLGFIVLYFGGFSCFTLFFFFFFFSSLLSKLKRSVNKREKKGSQRDLMQVIANGLPAVLGLFLTRIYPLNAIGFVGFASAIAEATADTWSSTFGIMSKKDPLSIVSFTKVPKGISGGVTVLGLFAGFLGSFLISILYFFVINSSWHHLLIITGTGFLGSVIDSVLGATVQVHYRRDDGTLTEKEWDENKRLSRARGIPGFDNDIVNLVSGLLALSLSLFLATVIK